MFDGSRTAKCGDASYKYKRQLWTRPTNSVYMNDWIFIDISISRGDAKPTGDTGGGGWTGARAGAGLDGVGRMESYFFITSDPDPNR